ncbi:hypothetical protein ACFO4E_14860 [Nocardiopsis mangrovi]|uniref:DUF4365 domain-containing protein n=1 Tax=Nocardiopsis mangrovi TaxID=1179818 RepID=A0ABV9E0Q0_9ACTN
MAVDLFSRVAPRELPDFSRVRCESGDVTSIAPTELRADSVVVCEDGRGEPQLAIITEVQLNIAKGKRRSWPQYATNLHARLACPVALLVLTPDDSVAKWCAAPIDFGCGEVRPVALSLTGLKPFTDHEKVRRHPELAMLAAAGSRTDDRTALDALVPALRACIEASSTGYVEYVLTALPARAKKYLEAAMNLRIDGYETEAFKRPFLEGEMKSRAEDVLLVLEKRGIEISGEARTRIASCGDIDTLTLWLGRAVTADRVEELFE